MYQLIILNRYHMHKNKELIFFWTLDIHIKLKTSPKWKKKLLYVFIWILLFVFSLTVYSVALCGIVWHTLWSVCLKHHYFILPGFLVAVFAFQQSTHVWPLLLQLLHQRFPVSTEKNNKDNHIKKKFKKILF